MTNDITNKQIHADQALFYCLCLLVFWLPLPFGSNRLWSSSLFCVLVLMLSAYWIYLYLQDKAAIPVQAYKALPVIALLSAPPLVAISQFIFPAGPIFKTIDISSTSHEALLGACLILFMTLCLLTLTDKSRIRIIIIVLIFSGLFQSVYGTMMTLTGSEFSVFMKKESYLGVATGTFINRNHLAGYLVLCLCAGIGLMISMLGSGLRSSFKYHTREIIRSVIGSKILIRLVLVMLVAGLVMTHSRMGNSAFFISLSIASIITLLFHRRSTKSMIIFFITILVIDFFVVGSFFGVSKIAERLQNTTSANESRDEVNSHSLAMIDSLDYSGAGAGAGSFYTLFPGYRTYDSGDGFYLHTHNDYLQFIIEYGLLPSIALFTGVALVFIYALLALRKRRSSLHIGIAFSSIMAIIAFAIHSTVDFNLQIPANAATFMLLLSLGLISYHQPSTAKRRSRANEPANKSCSCSASPEVPKGHATSRCKAKYAINGRSP